MQVQSKTKKLTFLAIMLGITIVLDIIGTIPLGAIQATITHIPTIITGVILGPLYGLIMGTLFGLVSLIHALTRPVALLDPLFVNPLVSVLPRMLIGLFSGLIYKLMRAIMKEKAKPVSIGISAAIGSLTNTFFVLTALYLIYAKDIVDKFKDIQDAPATDVAGVKALFLGIAGTVGIVEMLVCVVLVIPIVMAYYKFARGRGGI